MADFSEKTGEADSAGPPTGRPSPGGQGSGVQGSGVQGSGGQVSGSQGGGRSLAVAIADNRADAQAPRIVAKGQGKVADQILEIAFARGVKVRTDQNLAQVLAAIEIDSEVPLQALTAVAEILTYVYRANGDVARPEGGELASENGGENAGEKAGVART